MSPATRRSQSARGLAPAACRWRSSSSVTRSATSARPSSPLEHGVAVIPGDRAAPEPRNDGFEPAACYHSDLKIAKITLYRRLAIGRPGDARHMFDAGKKGRINLGEKSRCRFAAHADMGITNTIYWFAPTKPA